MTDGIRVPGEMLVDYGYVEELPANNAPVYLYGKGDNCECLVELPIRESYLWCPICGAEGIRSQLKRVYIPQTNQTMWHGHWNLATGQYETDRKKMEQHGRAHADKQSEELGIAHGFERVDYSELAQERANKGSDKHGNTVEAARVATHDRKVASGEKESRGKFVWD